MPKPLTPEEIIADYISRLVKVSTYAKREDVSVTEAQRRINASKIEGVKIDGMQFVLLSPPPQ